MQLYINEFVFRLNQKGDMKGTMNTVADILNNSIAGRLTYEDLTR
ncbi:MAG: hypothetical protein OXI40_14065 [Chloroflexota bacterium]|nr:hypothetical protein [Chloroflexota bacterium]